jgi:peptidoglycan/xylan/chitin deacetylase (PgdA/CDA1 family)
MAADGHEIGNHSFDHTGDPAKLAKQIPRTDKIVKDATGKTISLLRPPYGKLSDTTKKSGELVITWNVDSFDWKSRNADAIVERVMGMVTSGDIVLMHDIYSTTTSAALRIISALKEKGYAFVTVSDILKDPVEGKVYNSGTKEVRTMKVLYE